MGLQIKITWLWQLMYYKIICIFVHSLFVSLRCMWPFSTHLLSSGFFPRLKWVRSDCFALLPWVLTTCILSYVAPFVYLFIELLFVCLCYFFLKCKHNIAPPGECKRIEQSVKLRARPPRIQMFVHIIPAMLENCCLTPSVVTFPRYIYVHCVFPVIL